MIKILTGLLGVTSVSTTSIAPLTIKQAENVLEKFNDYEGVTIDPKGKLDMENIWCNASNGGRDTKEVYGQNLIWQSPSSLNALLRENNYLTVEYSSKTQVSGKGYVEKDHQFSGPFYIADLIIPTYPLDFTLFRQKTVSNAAGEGELALEIRVERPYNTDILIFTSKISAYSNSSSNWDFYNELYYLKIHSLRIH
ncbi:hypothetical protein CK556_01805 [Mesoplasma chauliocola]|uniref:Uncharacterized protein n=1 Tax=Mesoplasma chauliocola TaxID=216427 RepID=A0A249SNB2_9MOLU|nr:hypothetical protein [Mesoplasma chauliocola]ASZ09089.1 hypothetical protein CK556_01805 [Mesoplasma chauliocola]